MKARLPVMMPGHVRRRADGPAGGQSIKAASRPSADLVDEQISALLESLGGGEVRETSATRRARRPPTVPASTPSPPLVREHARAPHDREPKTVANPVAIPRGGAVAKARDLEAPPAHSGRRRGFLRDSAARERLFCIITVPILGLGVGFVVSLLLR